MEHKKLYTVISAILGALLAYALYNIVMSFVSGYALEWRFILYFLPVAAGITGLLIFLTSGFKKSGLLRLYMCYELLSFPFTVWFYIAFFSKDYGEFSSRPPLDWNFYLGVILDLLYLACCLAGLWYLGKRRIPRINYYGTGADKVGQFEPAGAGLRFANHIIDRVMIIFVVVKAFFSLRYWVDKDTLPESAGIIYVIEIVFVLLYYAVFEVIFNTTAGKCATNTTIVNDRGERPNFGQVLGRTFCRLIPFEAFSFFGAGARGWHDSIPDTYVVESIDRDDAGADEITLDAELNMQ
jgi:RDD family